MRYDSFRYHLLRPRSWIWDSRKRLAFIYFFSENTALHFIIIFNDFKCNCLEWHYITKTALIRIGFLYNFPKKNFRIIWLLELGRKIVKFSKKKKGFLKSLNIWILYKFVFDFSKNWPKLRKIWKGHNVKYSKENLFISTTDIHIE